MVMKIAPCCYAAMEMNLSAAIEMNSSAAMEMNSSAAAVPLLLISKGSLSN